MYSGMYMALHIADSEVSALAAELARLDKISKTEMLRRLLRREVVERKLREQRQQFLGLATQIIQESRDEGQQPVTKDEMDELWGQ
jgi:hypothetical protein